MASTTLSTAISSTTSLHSVPNGKSQAAVAQGQVNRARSVANNPASKADAAKQAAKIQDAKQQVQQASAPSRSSRVELNVASNDSATRNVGNLGDSLHIRRPTNETVGTRLDVYA